MNEQDRVKVEEAKEAAVQVLLHNLYGPCQRLYRTAGWGYPEPYTRDIMLSALGILATGNAKLIYGLRRVLIALAKNQTAHGHIVSLAHDQEERGASDTTPLFLMTLAIFRKVMHEPDFLDEAAHKALTWMAYQSPCDRVVVAQQPTTDWRDEQWVLGFGLFVNMVVFSYLRLFNQDIHAAELRRLTSHLVITGGVRHRHIHEGLVVPHKPYYALWAFKIFSSERFDLLGNALAILSGFAAPTRAKALIRWIEEECDALRAQGELAVSLPPNFFPYIRPGDPDWRSRYAEYNRPGEYHNGGVWPFICGLYVAAVQAVGFDNLAEEKLLALTELVRPAYDHEVAFGFNEWIRAQDGAALGNDWQTWTAALYLYAAACVEQHRALYFDYFRDKPLPHVDGKNHFDWSDESCEEKTG